MDAMNESKALMLSKKVFNSASDAKKLWGVELHRGSWAGLRGECSVDQGSYIELYTGEMASEVNETICRRMRR